MDCQCRALAIHQRPNGFVIGRIQTPDSMAADLVMPYFTRTKPTMRQQLRLDFGRRIQSWERIVFHCVSSSAA